MGHDLGCPMPSVDVARPYSHSQGRANLAPCRGSCTHPAHGLFTLPSCSQAWPGNELCSQCLQDQFGQQPDLSAREHTWLPSRSVIEHVPLGTTFQP